MKYANGVKATTLTTGTGDVTLAAVSGYVPFPLAFSVGDTIPYAIRNGQNWEWGVGTVQAGGVLERTEVVSTLVAGVFTVVAPARITLTGVSEVVCAITAEDYKALNDSLLAHTTDVANPHGVTAAQAGADATGTAATLIAAHESALDPHDAYALEADLGTAAFLDVGTAVGDVVQVQAGGKLPPLDASDLLNLPESGLSQGAADLLYAPITEGVTNGDAHDHSGGDGSQIAYTSLSGLPTLGSAAAAATGDFEAAGAVSAHNAAPTAHGISAWGATLVDDANQATARTTLGLGTAATTDSTAYATATQGSNADAHAAASAPHAGHSTPASVATLISTHNSDGAAHPSLAPTTATMGALLNGATSKTTPVDADQLGLMDSAASNIWKKLSWANLKAALSSVFVLLAGKAGGQKVIGGTGTADSLDLQSTSGVGATGAQVRILVGNNGGTQAVTVLNNGNVGIGTVSPSARIHVTSTTEQLRLGYDAANYLRATVNASGDATFGTAATASALTILANGNVGIGTTSPSRKSTVWGSQLISSTGQGASVFVDGLRVDRYSGVGQYGILNQFSGAMQLTSTVEGGGAYGSFVFNSSNNGTTVIERVRIDGSGRLGLGTASASAHLHAVSTTEQLRLGYDASNYLGSTTNSAGVTTFNLVGTAPAAKWAVSDATADSIYDVATFSKNSTGAGAAGLGARIVFAAKSSTTVDTPQAGISSEWVNATHATRTSRLKLSANDYGGARDGIIIESDGAVPRLGFYGATAVVKPTALTATVSAAPAGGTGTADGGWDTSINRDLAIATINNLKTRVDQLETKLQALGLLT